eukprot:766277-Hanusia_phi.AAC.2
MVNVQAVMNGNKAVLSCLLNAGSDPSAVTFDKQSPIDFAEMYIDDKKKRGEFIELLRFFEKRLRRQDQDKQAEDEFGKAISLNTVLETVDEIQKSGNMLGEKELEDLMKKINGANKEDEYEKSDVPSPLLRRQQEQQEQEQEKQQQQHQHQQQERGMFRQESEESANLSELQRLVEAAYEEDNGEAKHTKEVFFEEFKEAKKMFPVEPIELNEELTADKPFDEVRIRSPPLPSPPLPSSPSSHPFSFSPFLPLPLRHFERLRAATAEDGRCHFLSTVS